MKKTIAQKLDDKKEMILSGRTSGKTLKELSQEHKCSLATMNTWLTKNMTQEDYDSIPVKVPKEELIKMRLEGKTLRDIATHFNVSHQAIHHLLKTYGLLLNNQSNFYRKKKEDLLIYKLSTIEELLKTVKAEVPLVAQVLEKNNILEQYNTFLNEIKELLLGTGEISEDDV